VAPLGFVLGFPGECSPKSSSASGQGCGNQDGKERVGLDCCHKDKDRASLHS
jgi:hypothetical protein